MWMNSSPGLAELGWAALCLRLPRAAPVKPLPLSLPGPCWSLSSLSGCGSKAAPFRQYLSSRRSSCGSLQSHHAALAGANPSSLMPPRNGLIPSSVLLCSALCSCQRWGSELAPLLCLHHCYYRTGKCWMRKTNNNDAVFLSKFRGLKFWLENLCLEIWAQIMKWANTVTYCNSMFEFKWV